MVWRLSGGKDLYIDQSKFHAQFAADVPAQSARLMAVSQRPVAEAALLEPSGDPGVAAVLITQPVVPERAGERG